MAWVKIPKEHHEIFVGALPDRGVDTVKMFGAIAALVNGNMAGGLWARSAIVRVSEDDQRAILAMDGGMPFDPMGNGRVMKDTVVLPEDVFNDPEQLRTWLQKAVAFTATMPPKKKKGAAPPPKKAAQKKVAPKKVAPKKVPKKKVATKKVAKKKNAKRR